MLLDSRTTLQPELVCGVQRKADRTIVELANGESLTLPPFRYLSVGDALVRRRLLGQELVLKAATSPLGLPSWVVMAPAYKHQLQLPMPPFEERVVIRERLSEADWARAKPLESFHYRGKGLNLVVGRRAVLMAEIEGYGIVGYGVVSSTLPSLAPRMRLFNVTFTEQYSTGLINRLVRIPRIVVHPEFRNVGLGRLLAEHLFRYVRHWWDIKGAKPLAVEVVAAMTEFHPFFEEAGFVHVGMTHASGVVMPRYGTNGWAARPQAGGYSFEKPLTSKPYLIRALTLELADRINKAATCTQTHSHSDRTETNPGVLASAHNISLNYSIELHESVRVSLVREAFGIHQEHLEFPVLHNFSFDLHRGDVVLVTGASGSGKSTLLRALGGCLRNGTIELRSGKLEPLCRDDVAWLNLSFPSGRAVVDQFGSDLSEAISALNIAGLGEAHLYLKPPALLSEGQRHRLGLALLAASGKSIWLADDFLANLDRRTASIVAWGLSKLVRRTGKTAIVASPDPSAFVHALLPNVIVELRWAASPRIHRLQSRRFFKDGQASIALSADFAASRCEIWKQSGSRARIVGCVDPMDPRRSYQITLPGSGWLVLKTPEGVGTLVPPIAGPNQPRLLYVEGGRV